MNLVDRLSKAHTPIDVEEQELSKIVSQFSYIVFRDKERLEIIKEREDIRLLVKTFVN